MFSAGLGGCLIRLLNPVITLCYVLIYGTDPNCGEESFQTPCLQNCWIVFSLQAIQSTLYVSVDLSAGQAECQTEPQR